MFTHFGNILLQNFKIIQIFFSNYLNSTLWLNFPYFYRKKICVLVIVLAYTLSKLLSKQLHYAKNVYLYHLECFTDIGSNDLGSNYPGSNDLRSNDPGTNYIGSNDLGSNDKRPRVKQPGVKRPRVKQPRVKRPRVKRQTTNDIGSNDKPQTT